MGPNNGLVIVRLFTNRHTVEQLYFGLLLEYPELAFPVFVCVPPSVLFIVLVIYAEPKVNENWILHVFADVFLRYRLRIRCMYQNKSDNKKHRVSN